MLTFIERLREKPKHTRVQVSFVAAVSVTALVALVWGATLPLRLSGLTSVASETSDVQQEETGSFFSSTRANMAQLISAFGGGAEEQGDEVPVETSASGTYRVGAPAEAAPYDGTGLDQRSAAQPVSARQVQIATSTD